MDIKHFFNIAKRWLWLVIAGVIIGAAVGYFVSSRQTPIYEASSKFVILRAPQTTYDYYAYLDNQQLISTYVQLLSTESVLQKASDELGFPIYKGQATASPITDTQFVVLTVRHTEPEKAALIAKNKTSKTVSTRRSNRFLYWKNKLTNFQQPPLSLSSRVSKSKSWKHKAK